MRKTLLPVLVCLALFLSCSRDCPKDPADPLTREIYADRLRAMWLAECIANWTGLVTESIRRRPPFFTDADWGTRQGLPWMNNGLIDFVFQTPWGSDDDTDIEYIYLDAMARAGRAMLTAEEIREAWISHIDCGRYVWVSNAEAYELMDAPACTLPPGTSLMAANDQSLMIDAQLTTEIFGAVAPGMPVEALRLADLPIRVTASGYAAHAAQFHVALYALATVADEGQSILDRILWIIETARRLIPDTSKTADVIDFVVGDYLDNPDRDDWERTRDAVCARYQLGDDENGFKYLSHYESSVNLATGLIALLYGEGDIGRTIRIGTLTGWDCDNGTATMAGALGLMLGTDAVMAAFPEIELSDYYDILRTRVGFDPPHCVDWHPNCLDTLTEMAARMVPLAEDRIVSMGGSVDFETGHWEPPRIDFDALSAADNLLSAIDSTSANNQLRRAGEAPTVSWSGVSEVVSGPTGMDGSEICDGLEYDFSGLDRALPVRKLLPLLLGHPNTQYYAIARASEGAEEITASVVWETPLDLTGVRFVEGPHVFGDEGMKCTGSFDSVEADVRIGDEWVPLPGPPTPEALDADIAYEIVEWIAAEPLSATGVRVRGRPSEETGHATIAELEGILRPY